jgi:hypothetical protein
MIFYLFPGNGYQFKAGGGAGPRFCNIEETYNSKIPYSCNSTGVGFVLRGEGNTTLGSNLYAYIAGSLNADFCGNVKMNTEKKIELNSYSAGLRLGLTYIF